MLWKAPWRSRVVPAAVADRGGCRDSPGLRELLEGARRLAPARALDLGPADQSTLRVLGDLRLEVNVAALDPEGSQASSLPDYEDGAFAAILAWDYLVRLRAARRERLASCLVRWLAPGGGMLVILPIPSRRGARAHRFRLRSAFQIESLPLGPVEPAAVPTTREVLAMFSGLECSGARILRHGSREFFLRRPRAGA
jgi:hypothetical protein